MTRSILITFSLAVVLVAGGCGGSHSTSSATGSKRTLTNLQNIDQLKTAFNTASGEPRLIILVSPT
jgi:hypothetical protein